MSAEKVGSAEAAARAVAAAARAALRVKSYEHYEEGRGVPAGSNVRALAPRHAFVNPDHVSRLLEGVHHTKAEKTTTSDGEKRKDQQ